MATRDHARGYDDPEDARAAARKRWDADQPVRGRDVPALIAEAVESMRADGLKVSATDHSWMTRRQKDSEIARHAAEIQKTATTDRAEIATLAQAIVVDIARKVLAGQIPVTTSLDAQRLSDCFINILRLEGGQPTSITGAVTREEILAGITDLQEKATERANLTAVPGA